MFPTTHYKPADYSSLNLPFKQFAELVKTFILSKMLTNSVNAAQITFQFSILTRLTARIFPDSYKPEMKFREKAEAQPANRSANERR
jgi:hypothetical protein